MQTKLLIALLLLTHFAFGDNWGLKTLEKKDKAIPLAELYTNVVENYIPERLVPLAQAVGQIKDEEAIDVLELILEKCNTLDAQYTKLAPKKAIDIGRAYALYGLAIKAKKYTRVNPIIENNFVLSRATAWALYKAKYPKTMDLISNEIEEIFRRYPGASQDNVDIEVLKTKYQGVAFLLNSYQSKEVVDPLLMDQMVVAAAALENTKMRNGIKVCGNLLDHEGSYLWQKLVFRAILNASTQAANKYELFQKALKNERNRESDTCQWDLDNPNSISFSIKNISTEAYLLLSMWQLPYSLNSKIRDTLPSLKSKSFTARAAAIDCLATDPKASKELARVLKSDDQMKHFMKIRLNTETNKIARILLENLNK